MHIVGRYIGVFCIVHLSILSMPFLSTSWAWTVTNLAHAIVRNPLPHTHTPSTDWCCSVLTIARFLPPLLPRRFCSFNPSTSPELRTHKHTHVVHSHVAATIAFDSSHSDIAVESGWRGSITIAFATEGLHPASSHTRALVHTHTPPRLRMCSL